MEFDINRNSYCLTINDEKYNFLCNRFQSVGLTPPKRFNGFVAKGCMHYVRANLYGQISIVEMARQQNLPYVIIFEDDAFPCNNIVDRISSIYDSTQKSSCDVLYLGRNGDASLWNHRIEQLHSNPIEIKNQYSSHEDVDTVICRIKKNVFGNQAYVVFKEGYDKFIYTMLEGLLTNQMCYADIILSTNPYTSNLYVTKPLFIQYDFKKEEVIRMSDIENGKGYMVVQKIQEFNNKEFEL